MSGTVYVRMMTRDSGPIKPDISAPSAASRAAGAPFRAVHCRSLLPSSDTRNDYGAVSAKRVVIATRPRECPFCGGRIVLGGISVLSITSVSMGFVCLHCHASVRHESDLPLKDGQSQRPEQLPIQQHA
jgi:DNA-directed RNA polymerase subunit RPC12/RpoP